MSSVSAAMALLAATEDLGRAIEGGDWDGLEQALTKRKRSFEEFRDAGDPGNAELRSVLERVRALDREIEAAAGTALNVLRSELGKVGVARHAARGYRAPAEPPRFIARRV